MSNEIEVGEYVRTKKGQIDRLQCEINGWRSKNAYGEVITRCEKDIYLLKDIVKHSKDIIDLIEVGDYVNGRYVKEINNYKDGKSIIALIGIIDSEDIKTVVTHEQFSSIEYKF